MRRPPLKAILLVALVPCVLVLGIWLGASPDRLPGFVPDALVGSEEAQVVSDALDRIEDEYIDEVDPAAIANAAIAGAVDELDDDFSAYFTPSEYERFEQATNSEFSGVGLTVTGVEQGLRVQSVFDDSPAQEAGIRVGDLVVAADGESLRGKPTDAATALIKGPEGTAVRLRLRRGERTFTERVRRATISVPVVESELVRAGGERVAHVTLTSFSSGSHGELAAAIREARDRDAQGIVFDLRGNGGGLVSEAQLVASAFLQRGDIVTTRGRSVPTRTLEALGQPVAGELPVVVLVNEGTASASEIVTGALQDHERATVVGETTFGKGVFQEVLPLANGGALDLTVGRYFTPDGRNLGGAGIRPDVRAVDDPETEERDEALREALEVLGRDL